MKSKTNGHVRTKANKRKILITKKAITHAAVNAKNMFVDVEENVEKYAKANPWKTMGFSLLAGVIVSQILHLRK